MPGLEDEGGITAISLANAKKLVDRFCPPGQLYFEANQKQGEYNVTAFWPHNQYWIFSGFGWGYFGTGRSGFVEFLQLCGLEAIDAEKLIAELERRMDEDKWHCSSSSYSLSNDFLKQWGWL